MLTGQILTREDIPKTIKKGMVEGENLVSISPVYTSVNGSYELPKLYRTSLKGMAEDRQNFKTMLQKPIDERGVLKTYERGRRVKVTVADENNHLKLSCIMRFIVTAILREYSSTQLSLI